MAVVLVVRPYGLMGAAPSIPPTTPLAEFRTLVVPPGRGAAIVALAAARPGRAPAGDGRRVSPGARHRHSRVRAVRGEPAVRDGHRRHGLVRARGLLRPRRLRGGARREARPADGSRACAGAPRRDGGGARRGRVLRPALRRLSRDADARVRADRLVDRLPVERRHRRLERRRRRVARRVARRARPPTTGSPSALVGDVAGGDRVDRAHAVRLFAARLPRFAATRRGHRHRRAQDAMDRVRAGGRLRGSRRRPLCVLEGQHLAGDARDSALGRRAGDGIARRPQCAARPPARGGGLHVALRHARARHPVLARGAGRRDHRDRGRGARRASAVRSSPARWRRDERADANRATPCSASTD